MREHYLEIPTRKGKPLAAYLYLSAASGVKSVRTESKDAGLLVDFGPEDQPYWFRNHGTRAYDSGSDQRGFTQPCSFSYERGELIAA